MTNKQKKFIEEIIEDVKKEILEKAKDIPEEWDGIELRWLIKDRFSLVVMGGIGSEQRKKDYKNEVLVKNLI